MVLLHVTDMFGGLFGFNEVDRMKIGVAEKKYEGINTEILPINKGLRTNRISRYILLCAVL